MFLPTLDEFIDYSKKYNIVPVYTKIVADTETPISLYQKLTKHNPVYLLESGEGKAKTARFSIIGCNPVMTFISNGQEVELIKKGKVRQFSGNPLEILKTVLEGFKGPALSELPRFYGGGVGYLAYETVRFIEDVGDLSQQSLEQPDTQLLFTESVIVYDHRYHTLTMINNVEIDEGTGLETGYNTAVNKLKSLVEDVSAKHKENESLQNGAQYLTTGENLGEVRYKSSINKEDYEKIVRKAKEYIAAGDIFQVVLSQRLEVELNTDSWTIYRVLRSVNPSPYMYYINFGEMQLVGASPEMMVRKEEDEITTRPIAGTRRRGKTLEEDRKLAQELFDDPKEQAEHLMLLDLGRNDIGKVSEYGSVVVKEMFNIDYFSHVMHMVSEVRGQMKKNSDPVDVFAACFPAGTVSGAPKVRAMQIINELEPVQRGPYAGAVGYFAYNGNMDTAITIRTMIVIGDKAYIQAGAGVVADSVPAREYEETLEKAAGLLKVLKIAREGEGKNVFNR